MGGQVDKWVTAEDIRADPGLLQLIAHFNVAEGRLASTSRLLRSVAILYRADVDFLELCHTLTSAV